MTIRFLLFVGLLATASAFIGPSGVLKRSTPLARSPFILYEGEDDAQEERKPPEPKIIIKAPQLPREEDGKVHIPVIPAFGAFLALFASTTFTMRENKAKMAKKQAEREAAAEAAEAEAAAEAEESSD